MIHNWWTPKSFIFAAVIALFFALTFKDKVSDKPVDVQ